MTWEYWTAYMLKLPKMAETIRTLGESGWELVTVVSCGAERYTAFLKRVKSSEVEVKSLTTGDDADWVTEEWLKSVGFTYDKDSNYENGWRLGCVCWEDTEVHIETKMRAENVCTVTTKGQMRLLCDALSIKLEEQS